MPLLGAIGCGLGGRWLGRQPAAILAIMSVAASCALSAVVALQVIGEQQIYNFDWYTWAVAGELKISIGFLVDGLTAVMLLVVTSVSLMVHIFTVGYMRDDPGYQRFFSYIALFTFAMLMLVMSNNFLQLFFGWEAVGLVSYLLIGFWFTRPTAIAASLKAFLVNRVGDFGFLIGIGLVLAYANSLDYQEVFAARSELAGQTINLLPSLAWQVPTVICLMLFIGAMGKSAQFPLHVWLPDSMEGPTPISALIHAATMVTAGIFMVARMAPLFELSVTALTTVMIVGGITAFFMALLGLVQHDIKRVVAYSTLSQLGYMTAALGASAYSAAIFHLVTHAYFKALLFLGAGAVIVALHHQQDMRKMGGLGRKMPITLITMLIGAVALCGLPPFAGFFSKDLIIEAVGFSGRQGSEIVRWALVAAAVMTPLYTFRLLALVFWGGSRMEMDDYAKVRDCSWSITVPLVALAVPSAVAGWLLLEPMLAGNMLFTAQSGEAASAVMAQVAELARSPLDMVTHSVATASLWAAVIGTAIALYLYLIAPDLPGALARGSGVIYRTLLAKYWLDELNYFVFAKGARRLGSLLWEQIDTKVIDGSVNGMAQLVRKGAKAVRLLQSGLIYHYAFVMIMCLAAFAAWKLQIR